MTVKRCKEEVARLLNHKQREQKFRSSNDWLSDTPGDIIVKIVNHSTEFDAHSFVLCQASDVFAEMIMASDAKGQCREISLPSYYKDSLSAIYKFLYTCCIKGIREGVDVVVENFSEHVESFLGFAKEYEVSHLRDVVSSVCLKKCGQRVLDVDEVVWKDDKGGELVSEHMHGNFVCVSKVHHGLSRPGIIQMFGNPYFVESLASNAHDQIGIAGLQWIGHGGGSVHERLPELFRIDPRTPWSHLPKYIALALKFDMANLLNLLLKNMKWCCERCTVLNELQRNKPILFKDLFDGEYILIVLAVEPWQKYPESIKYVLEHASFKSDYESIFNDLANGPDTSSTSELAKSKRFHASLVDVHMYFYAPNSPVDGFFFSGWDLNHFARAQLFRHQPLGKFCEYLTLAFKNYYQQKGHKDRLLVGEDKFTLGIFRTGSEKCEQFTEEEMRSLTLQDLGFSDENQSIDLYIDWEGRLEKCGQLLDDNYRFINLSQHGGVDQYPPNLNDTDQRIGERSDTMNKIPNGALNGPYVDPDNSSSSTSTKVNGNFPQGSFLVFSNHWQSTQECFEVVDAEVRQLLQQLSQYRMMAMIAGHANAEDDAEDDDEGDEEDEDDEQDEDDEEGEDDEDSEDSDSGEGDETDDDEQEGEEADLPRRKRKRSV